LPSGSIRTTEREGGGLGDADALATLRFATTDFERIGHPNPGAALLGLATTTLPHIDPASQIAVY